MTFLRTNGKVKYQDGSPIPTVSILVPQFVSHLKAASIPYSKPLLAELTTVYKGLCKSSHNNFLDPESTGLEGIPPRGEPGSCYYRCLHIYKSGMSRETLDALEKGTSRSHFKTLLSIYM